MSSKLTNVHDVLRSNRLDAIALVQGQGLADTKRLLEEAARDLRKRIQARVRPGQEENFTQTQLKVTLAQVTDVLKTVVHGLRDTVLSTGEDAAEAAADHTVEYLRAADKAFRGTGTQPLALNEAKMFSEATEGVNASILRRLASTGKPIEGADEEPHPAKLGILERYGVETIGYFERELQRGLVTNKPWSEMEADLIERSPFLQEAPAYWAHRIVRCECASAYNRASWESIREADEQLEDMVKILSAHFDERTASDSYAVHGECRRPEEAFETWYGLMQHPPARPMDREIIVPHRISWPIPSYLTPMTNEQVVARWKMEQPKTHRKGFKVKPMPPRPLLTTVPFASFGRTVPPRLSAGNVGDDT